jgi:hypothetical protein
VTWTEWKYRAGDEVGNLKYFLVHVALNDVTAPMVHDHFGGKPVPVFAKAKFISNRDNFFLRLLASPNGRGPA